MILFIKLSSIKYKRQLYFFPVPMHIGVVSQFPVVWQVVVTEPFRENPKSHVKEAVVTK